MTDYSKTTNFTAKDALNTGDAAKLIKGSLFDTEFDNLATSSATKYDVGDLASQAEAEAGTSSSKLMTPERTEEWSAVWAAENAGAVGDLQAIADPGADRIVFWDESDNAIEFLTIGAGLTLTTNDLAVDQSSATVQGKVELATTTEVNTGSDTARAVTPAGLVQCTNLLQATASQRGAAEIATQAEVDTGSDTARYVTPATLAASKLDVQTRSTDQTFAISDANSMQVLTGGTNRAWTIPPNSSVAFVIGSIIICQNSGTGNLSITAGVGVIIDSIFHAAAATAQTDVVEDGGTAVLIKTATDTWALSGDIRDVA